MDDLDDAMFIFEAEEDISNYNRERELELSKNPDWLNISLGLVPASDQAIKEAEKIRREFWCFKALEGELFHDIANRFIKSKLNK